jgi:hypothetical protein
LVFFIDCARLTGNSDVTRLGKGCRPSAKKAWAPVCGAAPMFSQASGRRGVASGNHKNSRVPCLVAEAILHEVRGSHIDPHPRRILGGDIYLWARRWAERGTRWIRRPWFRRTRWTRVVGIFFRALLGSFDWTLDWALFRSYLWTSRPRSQPGVANRITTEARECYSVAGIRAAGLRPSAEESFCFWASHLFLPPAQSLRLWRMSLRMD